MNRAQDFTVEGGSSYRLKVLPTVHSATDSFKALALEKRKCRFHSELPAGEATMFQGHRFKSCVFNCMLRNVVST